MSLTGISSVGASTSSSTGTAAGGGGGADGAYVILSEAKDLKLRILRSFAVSAAQDDGV
jgi:hypothetical protein